MMARSKRAPKTQTARLPEDVATTPPPFINILFPVAPVHAFSPLATETPGTCALQVILEVIGAAPEDVTLEAIDDDGNSFAGSLFVAAVNGTQETQLHPVYRIPNLPAFVFSQATKNQLSYLVHATVQTSAGIAQATHRVRRLPTLKEPNSPTVTISSPIGAQPIPVADSFTTYGHVNPTTCAMGSYAVLQGTQTTVYGTRTKVQGYDWAFNYQLKSATTWTLTVSAIDQNTGQHGSSSVQIKTA
jgi:hypothetical protein